MRGCSQINLALRFDHAHSHSLSSPSLPFPLSLTVAIPTHTKPFPKPMFLASLTSLFVVMLGFNLLRLYTNWFGDVGEMNIFAMYVSTGLVLAGTTAGAWLSGVWDDWWAYEER